MSENIVHRYTKGRTREIGASCRPPWRGAETQAHHPARRRRRAPAAGRASRPLPAEWTTVRRTARADADHPCGTASRVRAPPRDGGRTPRRSRSASVVRSAPPTAAAPPPRRPPSRSRCPAPGRRVAFEFLEHAALRGGRAVVDPPGDHSGHGCSRSCVPRCASEPPRFSSAAPTAADPFTCRPPAPAPAGDLPIRAACSATGSWNSANAGRRTPRRAWPTSPRRGCR